MIWNSRTILFVPKRLPDCPVNGRVRDDEIFVAVKCDWSLYSDRWPVCMLVGKTDYSDSVRWLRRPKTLHKLSPLVHTKQKNQMWFKRGKKYKKNEMFSNSKSIKYMFTVNFVNRLIRNNKDIYSKQTKSHVEKLWGAAEIISIVHFYSRS